MSGLYKSDQCEHISHIVAKYADRCEDVRKSSYMNTVAARTAVSRLKIIDMYICVLINVCANTLLVPKFMQSCNSPVKGHHSPINSWCLSVYVMLYCQELKPSFPD